MKDFWNVIQLLISALGGWLGYFLGGCDGLLYALLAFVVIDYITGVMCAVNDHTLSSEVGFRGICRKVLVFLLVGIANVLDVQVIGTGSVLRTAVIFFYISNEGVSLLENATHLGLPVPEKITLCQKGVGLIRLLFGQHQYFHSGRQIQCTVETCGSCSYDNDIVIFFHFCFLVPVDAGFSVGFCIFMFSDL